METRLRLRKFRLERGSNPGPLDQLASALSYRGSSYHTRSKLQLQKIPQYGVPANIFQSKCNRYPETLQMPKDSLISIRTCDCTARRYWPIGQNFGECSVVLRQHLVIGQFSLFSFFSAFHRSPSTDKPRVTPISFVRTTESYTVSLATTSRQTSYDSRIHCPDYGIIRGLSVNYTRFAD